MKRTQMLLIAAPLSLATAFLGDDEGRLSNKRADTPPAVIAVAAAHGLAPGVAVMVQGRVNVASGVFQGATMDPGFALHDGTRGIYIKTATDQGREFGDTLRVEGVMDLLNGMLCIDADDVQPIREREIQLPTGHVPVRATGSIVVVQGVIQRIVDDAPFGTKVFVDDGTGEVDVFLSSSTDIDVAELGFIEVGQRIRARGYVAFFPQFSNHAEIDPRSTRDLREIDD